jgi:hypothetical protein
LKRDKTQHQVDGNGRRPNQQLYQPGRGWFHGRDGQGRGRGQGRS